MKPSIQILALTLFIYGFTFMACHKEQPEHWPASHLSGKKWDCSICVNQTQSWDFGDSTGIAFQVYMFGQDTFYTNKYFFAACEDTLHLFNKSTNGYQKWTVDFENDSTANIFIQGAAMQPIQQLKQRK